MGICSTTQKSCARDCSKLIDSRTSKSPLIFIVERWPLYKTFSLVHLQNAQQTQVEAFVNLYEKKQITIVGSKTENVTDLASTQGLFLSTTQQSNKRYNYSLTCSVEHGYKSYSITFPSDQQRKYVMKFVWEWSQIEEKDLIKVGRSIFKLCLLSKGSHNLIKKEIIPVSRINTSSGQQHQCRICHSGQTIEDNPLICPCACSNQHYKYAHLACIVPYLISINNDFQEFITLKVSGFICENCSTVMTQTTMFEIYQKQILNKIYQSPTPYAIFQKKNIQGFRKKGDYHVISLNSKNPYTIGRSKKASIRMPNDTSVSNKHSALKYQNDKLFVKDNQSTHGTLINVRNQIMLNSENNTETFAYHNLVIKAIYKPPFKTDENDQV